MKKMCSMLIICIMMAIMSVACGKTEVIGTEGEQVTETLTPTQEIKVTETQMPAEKEEVTDAPTPTQEVKVTNAPTPTREVKVTENPVPTQAAEKYTNYTYDFSELGNLTYYGCSYDVTKDGVLNICYENQYGATRFYLEDLVELEHCEEIRLRVKSEYEPIAIQLYDETVFTDQWTSEKQIYFSGRTNGIEEFVIKPEVDIDLAAFGIMSLENPTDPSKYKVNVYDITFRMEKGYAPMENLRFVQEVLTEKGDVTCYPSEWETIYTNGVRYELQKDNSIKLQYDRQYGEVKFLFPKAVDLNQCLGITVKADVYEPTAFTFYDKKILVNTECESMFTKWAWNKDETDKFFSLGEFPAELTEVYGMGVMSTDPVMDTASEAAQVFEVVFHMADGTELKVPKNIAPDVTEDMTLLNTYGAEFEHFAVAATVTEMNHPVVMPMLKQQYNSISHFGFGMEPDYLCGTTPQLISVAEAKKQGYFIPENYNESTVPAISYTDVDAALEACGKNGFWLRFHTLIWHSATSEWFFREGYSADAKLVRPDVMDARVEYYVRNVLEHVHSHKYGYVVYAWDIVNEYYHSKGISNWRLVYGEQGLTPSFVKLAYKVADEVLREHGVRDKVSLLYNDFNTYVVNAEENTPDDLIELVSFINSDGKICDGIGMQAHLVVHSMEDYSDFGKVVQKFVDAGLEVQLTEFDINIWSDTKRENSLETQAEMYETILTDLVKIKRNGGNITCITLWGTSDLDIHPESSGALLFERQDRPKDVYYKALQAYTELK